MATFTASAGADREIRPYELVSLAGTVSGGAPRWRQVSGPAVDVIGGLDSATLRFVAPEDPTPLVFELTVREGADVRARDTVTLNVPAPLGALGGVLRRRITVAGGGPGRAEAAAHEPVSQRLFVLDGVARVVLAYDVQNPDQPQDAGTLPAPRPKPGFVPGPPVAVVARGGVLAVVHEGVSPQVPGRVVFYDPLTLVELASWSTGPGPVDATITADARAIAVACAGGLDPSALSDPRGAVTWIRVPELGPTTINPIVDVRTYNFAGFDGLAGPLRADGVRLSRPTVPVSQDLEPRAVAFAPDGSSIFVSLPANNALARIDTVGLIVDDLNGLRYADWSGDGGEVTSPVGARFVPFEGGRPTATTVAGQSVAALDVEGLLSVEQGLALGEWLVEFVAARGPVLPRQLLGGAEPARPYALAADGPRTVRVAVSVLDCTITVLEERALTTAGGAPLSSRSNLRASAPGLALHDELAVDLMGAPLPLDPLGLHVGDAVRRGADLWLADLQRPSIARFDSNGALLARYVPFGANGAGVIVGEERLPAVYSQRVLDGGFEGVALSADGATLFAVLGRPLDNPDTADDAASRASRIVRLVALDANSGAVSGEYVYTLERAGHVVRDLDFGADGQLIVLEEDPDGTFSALFRLDLADATDLAQLGGAYAGISAALETTSPAALGGLFVPIVPGRKSLALDLGEGGLRASAFLGSGLGAELPLLARADGFGLAGATLDTATGTFQLPAGAALAPLALAPFGARGRQLDPSDVDEGAALRSFPVSGLRQALDLVAFNGPDGVLIAGADGGSTRILTGQPGYDETALVRDLMLDTLAFPNASELSADAMLGRLRVSRVDGDFDGDGLVEQLFAFGGRSVFLAKPGGDLLWDSGDRLDRRILGRQPERAQRLQAASTEFGAAPQSLALVELAGARYLAVGLGGSGSVALYDLALPQAPRFAGFVPTGMGANPVALSFVSASDAPDGRPILLIVDAAAGAVDLIELGAP